MIEGIKRGISIEEDLRNQIGEIGLETLEFGEKVRVSRNWSLNQKLLIIKSTNYVFNNLWGQPYGNHGNWEKIGNWGKLRILP